jgi:hypothetical protein
MRTRPILAAAALAVGLVTTGCDDEPTQVVDDTLNEAEATALASALLRQTIQTSLDAIRDNQPAGGPAAVPVDFSVNVSFTAPCPLGGEVSVDAGVAGTADSDGGSAEVVLDLGQAHQTCTLEDPQSGMQFIVTGAPGLTVVIDLSVHPDAFTAQGTTEGRVRWETLGGHGTCDLDLEFEAAGQPQSGLGAADVSGTICGISIVHFLGS